MKKKNAARFNKGFTVDDLLAEEIGMTRDTVKKRREAGKKYFNGAAQIIDGEDYFVFGIDTDRLEAAFKEKAGLRQVKK